MTKKEIMDYVVETPHNVNKNILGQKLDEFQKNVSWDDLKDKPFYREVETKVAVERQIAEFKPKGEWGDVFPIALPADIYDSKEVDILWDGVVYRIDGAELKGHEYDGPNGIFYIREISGQVYFTTFGEHPSEIGITYTSEIVHQVPLMFVPNSVWVEEETITVIDNGTVGGYRDQTYELTFTFADGDDITIIYNGTPYVTNGITRTSDVYNREDNCWMLPFADYYIQIGDWYKEGEVDEPNIAFIGNTQDSCTVSLIVSRNRTIKTNCDLMIKADENGVRLTQGDYAAALAKIKMGLPVSAYSHLVIEADNYAEVSAVCAEMEDSGNYILVVRILSADAWVIVLPDNTAVLG